VTPADAKRHAAHLCDVWLRESVAVTLGEHFGVIERIHRGSWAVVSGHPEYGTKCLPIIDLQTACPL